MQTLSHYWPQTLSPTYPASWADEPGSLQTILGPFDTGFSGSKHTTEALIAEGDKRLYLPNRP